MNKKQLYEQIMRSVSREVKRALNEAVAKEYYVWYTNLIDNDRSDMSSIEVAEFQNGRVYSGPYNSFSEAYDGMKEDVKNFLIKNYWWEFEGDFEDDFIEGQDIDDDFKFNYIINNCDKYTETKKNIIFRLWKKSNKQKWEILPGDKIKN